VPTHRDAQADTERRCVRAGAERAYEPRNEPLIISVIQTPSARPDMLWCFSLLGAEGTVIRSAQSGREKKAPVAGAARAMMRHVGSISGNGFRHFDSAVYAAPPFSPRRGEARAACGCCKRVVAV